MGSKVGYLFLFLILATGAFVLYATQKDYGPQPQDSSARAKEAHVAPAAGMQEARPGAEGQGAAPGVGARLPADLNSQEQGSGETPAPEEKRLTIQEMVDKIIEAEREQAIRDGRLAEFEAGEIKKREQLEQSLAKREEALGKLRDLKGTSRARMEERRKRRALADEQAK